MSKRTSLITVLSLAVLPMFTAQVYASNTLVSSLYLDTNRDGRIDHLKWTFDENITRCDYDSRDWSVDISGDMKLKITGISHHDPESTGEGACDGSDPVVYLSVIADELESGSSRTPLVSYRDEGRVGDLQDSDLIRDKTRRPQKDAAIPLVTRAELDFNDLEPKLSVYFTEPVALTDNQDSFQLSGADTEADLALHPSSSSYEGNHLELLLGEAQRVGLLKLAEENETGLLLDLSESAVHDLSELANRNEAEADRPIEQAADDRAPELLEWSLNLNQNQIIMTFSETVDPSSFKPSAITLQDSEGSSANSYSLSGGELIETGDSEFVINLSPDDINAIRSNSDLANSSADAYMAISSALVDDIAKNNNLAIGSSEALQASSFVGNGSTGKLDRAHLLLSNTQILQKTKAVASFEIDNDLPAGGQIEVVFPSEFDLTEISSAGGLIELEDELDFSILGQGVTVIRPEEGLSIPAGKKISFYINGIVNPQTEGQTQNFIFATKTAEGILIDEKSDVHGQTIILNSSVSAQAASQEYEKENQAQEESDELEDSEPEDIVVEKETTVTPPVSNFEDIENHWAETFIQQIAQQGIVQGKTNIQYAPNDNISQAELLKIALRAFDYNVNDATEGPWHSPYFAKALELSLLETSEEEFKPDEAASRGMAATLLVKAAGVSDVDQNFADNYTSKEGWHYAHFPDVLFEHTYAPFVSYLYDNGIIDGYQDGTFGANNPITRAEIAKMVVNILNTFVTSK